LFFDLRPHLRKGEATHELLQRIARAGVVLTPGSAAGRDFVDWARLCFTCVPTTALAHALATLERVLYASTDEAT
jgi:DNA-binding transcriptional MocR family regulator